MMSEVSVELQADGDLVRLNSRVYPVCEMSKRPSTLQAVYSVPEKSLTWFLEHCRHLGIRARRVDGRMSLLQQLAADDLEE